MAVADRVVISIDDHVAHVRLDRADTRNGLYLRQIEAVAPFAGTSV